MAVLAEAISVIVRRDAIDRVYPSGWAGFLDDVPNASLCTDGELARVGFLQPPEVKKFLDALSSRGLVVEAEDKFIDVAVVDQQRGPTLPCDWLEFGRFPIGEEGGKAAMCWLFEDPRIAAGYHMKGLEMDLATPPGWEYEGSLSAEFTFISNEEMEERLTYLRTEDGSDVYLDAETGKEVFVPSEEKQSSK